MKKIVYIHDRRSRPDDDRIKALISAGFRVSSSIVPGSNFASGVSAVQQIIDAQAANAIVCCNRSAAMVMCASFSNAGIILIAPDWKRHMTSKNISEWNIRCDPAKTMILHSRNDTIVAYSDSETLERNNGTKVIAIGQSSAMNDNDALEALVDSVNWVLK
jgi:predicted alpha/beta hydrolase family esterase